MDDVERILNTLVFDGVAEKLPFPHVNQGKEYSVFRSVDPGLSPPGILMVPCTFCLELPRYGKVKVTEIWFKATPNQNDSVM